MVNSVSMISIIVIDMLLCVWLKLNWCGCFMVDFSVWRKRCFWIG